jgi:hypothetical protein
MYLSFSRRLATAIGVALPLAETSRVLAGGSIAWAFDHYLMGAFLLYGAWQSRRRDTLGTRYLVAAWAFTCGVGYFTLFRHLEHIRESEAWVAWTIGFGWLLCVLGLVSSVRAETK